MQRVDRQDRYYQPQNVVWLDTSNLDIVLRRRRTPRHFSGRYPSDIYQTNDFDDGAMYPPAADGPFTGRYTPMKEGRGTPLRRSNTVVLGSRPNSRVNLGTQYGDYLRTTDSRLFYPDINNRLQTPAPPAPPTPQPIRRERTFGGFSQSDNEMDPFTKQYYTRMWKQGMSPNNLNLYRMGRAGGRWRHITSCTASSGSHMAFVEGTVKQVDNRIVLPRQMEPAKISVPQTINRVPSSKKVRKLNTTYNQHARNGFKYWYQEQNKPMDLASRFRMKARLLERGVW
ncbi:uncharacterized protein LOC125650960 isoform X5 [Ostrea edulis]|uniref:uncharacterized protein LOC125650960 isoform X5 n=1 Tax=Ostrea edulis TaxID=37623 RepID=UPI0020947583|nr:uncharacterized protein LOC125650960 isoform X5 [Ostrea edulis]